MCVAACRRPSAKVDGDARDGAVTSADTAYGSYEAGEASRLAGPAAPLYQLALHTQLNTQYIAYIYIHSTSNELNILNI